MSKKSKRSAPRDPDDDTPRRPHLPVMLAEVLAAIAPQSDELIVDGTFGAGGYTSAILDAAPCRVLAFDRDLTAIAAAGPVLEKYGARLQLLNAPFSTMDDAIGAGMRVDALQGRLSPA